MTDITEKVKENIGPVLGKIPSGLFILTARHKGQETGMLASWVSQAGFAPPSVTVAVKKGRYIGQWITEGARIALNLLSDQPSGKALLGHFAKGFEPNATAFEGVEVERITDGLPVLSGGIGYLECRLTGQVESGDHLIFLLEVLDGKYLCDDAPWVHIRKNGFNY